MLADRFDECLKVAARHERSVVVGAESGAQEGCRELSREQKLRTRLGVHVSAKRK